MVGRAVAAAFLFAVHGARRNTKKIASTCGVKGSLRPNTRIVNGDDATECEWRWQAQLWYGTSLFCGGSLISPEWVLTAAHCASFPDFTVRFGDWKLSQSSSNLQVRSAVEVYQHHYYNSSIKSYDLAMVKLDRPVEMNDCVGTVCLPEEADVPVTTKCWITGWGTLRSFGPKPDILQEGKVGIISNTDCAEKFDWEDGEIDESMLCARGKTADGKIVDACRGDSGGPLVCQNRGRWTLYGVTSKGNGCAQPTSAGVWARVHDELDWIQYILAGNEPTSPPPKVCPWWCRLPNRCERTQCMENCDFC